MLFDRLPVLFVAVLATAVFVLHAHAIRCYHCAWALKPENLLLVNETWTGANAPKMVASCEKPTSATPTCESSTTCASVSIPGNVTARGCPTAVESRNLAKFNLTVGCHRTAVWNVCVCAERLCNKA
ncbi:unnamed protein product, partial [Mesorhabditis spiculigera]